MVAGQPTGPHTRQHVERVKELHPMFRGDFTVILRDGRRLTLAKAYRDRLKV